MQRQKLEKKLESGQPDNNRTMILTKESTKILSQLMILPVILYSCSIKIFHKFLSLLTDTL